MASIQGLLDDRLATMERRISALEARLAEGSGQSLNLDDQRYESWLTDKTLDHHATAS